MKIITYNETPRIAFLNITMLENCFIRGYSSLFLMSEACMI